MSSMPLNGKLVVEAACYGRFSVFNGKLMYDV